MDRDVVVVLRAMPQTHEERRAIAAVAELIAADVEYDAAWETMRFNQGDDAGRLFSAAKKRRAAALAACKPENPNE